MNWDVQVLQRLLNVLERLRTRQGGGDLLGNSRD